MVITRSCLVPFLIKKWEASKISPLAQCWIGADIMLNTCPSILVLLRMLKTKNGSWSLPNLWRRSHGYFLWLINMYNDIDFFILSHPCIPSSVPLAYGAYFFLIYYSGLGLALLLRSFASISSVRVVFSWSSFCWALLSVLRSFVKRMKAFLFL